MDTQIVAVFCLVDDMLKAIHHYEDPQTQMSDAEVITTAILAALKFGGNYTSAREFLATHGYVPRMLSKSRFSRRLHRIKPFFLTLFNALGEHWKSLNEGLIYSIDTFPIPVCDNYRIPRAKIYQDEAYRGLLPAKSAISTVSKYISWRRKMANRWSSCFLPVGFMMLPAYMRLTLICLLVLN